jgi:hypothetical protein
MSLAAFTLSTDAGDFAGFHFLADGREVDEDDVGELILGVVGDADGASARSHSWEVA